MVGSQVVNKQKEIHGMALRKCHLQGSAQLDQM